MKKVIFVKVHPMFLDFDLEEWEKIEYRERWLVRQTRSLGFESKLFLLTNQKDIHHSNDGEVTFFPVDRLRVHKHRHTSKRMLQAIREGNPDLIIFKGLNYKLSRWILRKTKFAFKFAFIVGGSTKDKNLDKASYILAESLDQADQYFSAYKSKLGVLPKAIDTDLFRPDGGRKIYDVVNVGRFIGPKNHEALVPFFERHKVALVGSGPTWNAISKKAQPFGENVHMPKQLFGDELVDVVSKSQVMVHPSRSEGIPKVFMEAMSCGVPVIALSRTIKGIVTNGENGYLVDEEDLVSFTEDILGDKRKLDELGRSCRDYAVKHCGKNSTVPVLEKLYGEIL